MRFLVPYFYRCCRNAFANRSEQICIRISALASCLLLLVGTPQCATAQSRTQLSNSTALYARVLRLSHNVQASKNGGIVVSVAAFPGGNEEEDIYGSRYGVKFTQICPRRMPTLPAASAGDALRAAVGGARNLSAGTLLWAGSIGQNSTTQPMQLKVYQNSDRGRT